jgi:hypothetical protein
VTVAAAHIVTDVTLLPGPPRPGGNLWTIAASLHPNEKTRIETT